MSGIGLALSVASAAMQFRQAQAQAAMFEGQARGLEVQAEYTRFNAKGESLKYKKQAADSLEATLARMAQINAAAGAGHMDPFSSNPMGLRVRGLSVGGDNFAMAGLNETITRLTGESQARMQLYQAERARAAGKSAAQMGMMGAMLTLAGGAFQYYQTSIPGSTSTLIPNPGGVGPNQQTNQFSNFVAAPKPTTFYYPSNVNNNFGLTQGWMR
tara:strand:- start:2233 stop:2874 length:642 start_codon:yes stop_codon:yes gene_type:complete